MFAGGDAVSGGEEVGRTFVVSGRVQGVGFRWWARSTAAALGLRGTVRNRPDGGVEVRAWGDTAALDRLERELWSGPPAARVRAVETGDAGSAPGASDFHIVR